MPPPILPTSDRRQRADVGDLVEIVIHDNDDAESRYRVPAPAPQTATNGGITYRHSALTGQYEPEAQ